MTVEAIQVSAIYFSHGIMLYLEENQLCGYPTLQWIWRIWICIVCISTAQNVWNWCKDFSPNFARSHILSPSNKTMPIAGDISNDFGTKSRWYTVPNSRCKDAIVRRGSQVQAEMKGTLWQRLYNSINGGTANVSNNAQKYLQLLQKHLVEKDATKLGKMHHVHMSLYDYLWTAWFLLPSVWLNILIGGKHCSGLLGVAKLKFKRYFGITTPRYTEDMLHRTMVDVILNSSLLMYCSIISKTDNGIIMKLSIPHCTHTLRNMKEVIGDLSLTFNVINKMVIGTTFDNQNLKPHDALVCLHLALIANVHGIIHCFSNWSINLENKDWFVRRMGIVTARFNHVGAKSVPLIFGIFKLLGIVKYCNADLARIKLHQNHNIANHSNMSEIWKQSEFAKFIIVVRRFFLKTFEEYEDCFPGIDGEALFIGSVLHSLDHQTAAQCFDISQFEYDDIEFEADHEFATVVHSCFLDTPPCKLFELRFSHAPHPFYQKVYGFAVKINKRLADQMECCIAA